jgi:MoaE-MoaD fusion protein
MRLDVRFFALYRERAGRSQLSLELPEGATVDDLTREVRQQFPRLAPPDVRIVVAVNADYAQPDTVLHEGDEICLIPPVSGGNTMIKITYDPLDPEQITSQVRQDTNGAVVTFLGTTRVFSEGKRVVKLEYEAYEDMALKKLEEIRREMQAEFAIEDVAIAHRIGPVDIGQISLVVAVASPHRKEAFLACHKIVDRVKEIVPIWKKEVFEDGSRWVACENHEFATPEAARLHVHADNN